MKRPPLVEVPDHGLHDLPPRWDGLSVHWLDWKPMDVVFICPLESDGCETCGRPTVERDVCEACGSSGPTLVATGLVGDDPEMTPADVAADDEAVRLAHKMRQRRKRRSWIRLSAVRCAACGDDTVLDHNTGTAWTLDLSDYGDRGSTDPTPEGAS